MLIFCIFDLTDKEKFDTHFSLIYLYGEGGKTYGLFGITVQNRPV